MGNRLTKIEGSTTTSYVYDLCNKLLSETKNGITTEYVYDALGNLTTKTDNTGATTYVYDALNRLTEVVNPDGTWQKNTYDASGIRSGLCENGITTEYMTLNGMVLSGYDKNGERREHYFYGSSILGEELFGVATGTATAADTKETLCTFYLKNSHGDVIGQTDESGVLTKSYAYNVFGTLIHSTALDGLEDTMSRFLYSGEQYDEVSGLYYLRARHYDTEAGRFTQEDTYLGDGRNLYAYVHNNPVMYTDPSGHAMYKAYDSNPVPDDELVGALNGLGAALVGTVMVLQPLVEKTNEPYELIEETTEIVLQATGDESVAEDVTSGESAKEEGTSDGGCEQEDDDSNKRDEGEKESSSRPTWRQSEKDVAEKNPEYKAQQSFANGSPTSYGAAGSSRPDFYKTGSSIEVKNYNLLSESGRNALINVIIKQAQKRITDLPVGTRQTVIIDIRGQVVSEEILRVIIKEILKKVDVTIKFMR